MQKSKQGWVSIQKVGKPQVASKGFNKNVVVFWNSNRNILTKLKHKDL